MCDIKENNIEEFKLSVAEIYLKMTNDTWNYNKVYIEFFENYMRIYNINNKSNDEIFFFEPFELEVKYGSPGDYHMIGISDKVIIGSDSSVRIKKIEKFLIKLNQAIKNGRYYGKDEINQIIKNISNEAIPIALNFVKILPQSLTLDAEQLKIFEVFLANSDVNLRWYSLIKPEEADKITNLHSSFLNENDYINKFESYVKLISKKFREANNITEIKWKLITWIIFQDALVIYFSEKFEREILFIDDMKSGDVNSCVEIYCKHINLNNCRTMNLFHYYLLKHNILHREHSLIYTFNKLEKCIKDTIEKLDEEKFYNILLGKTSNNSIEYTINDIDLMNGNEFEHFIGTMFSKMGYSAEVTKQSGDQGLDVIVDKNGKKIGIQAKCYSNSVGNSAIQEAVAGKNYYNCDKVIVVTNNSFTNSAIELAQVNDVILWDRNILKEKILELF